MILHIRVQEDVDNAGIYLIYNRKNDYRYVGQTTCLKLRWRSHLDDLSKGTHSNRLLQYDYNLYGPEVFEFKILELSRRKDKEWLREREGAWMSRFDVFGPLGYNLAR